MKKIILSFFILCFIQSLIAVQMQQIETVPEDGLRTLYGHKNSFNILNEKSTFNSRDDRVSLLWQTSEPSAIAGRIAVSPVTGHSFVEWYLNDEYVALYADSAIPLWQYGASTDLDWEYPTDMTEDGSVLAFANMNTMNIFDPSSSTPTWQFTFVHNIRGLVLNTDGTRVFVAYYDSNLDITFIHSYDIGNPTSIWEVQFASSMQTLVISGDGSTLIMTQYGGIDAMWVLDAEDGSIIFEGPEYNQNPPAISYDASLIVNGDYSGYVQVYEHNETLETYEEIWYYRVEGGGYNSWIGGMCISDDGSTIAVGTLVFPTEGYDGEIYLFNSHSPTPIWVYSNTGDYVIDVDMNYDGSIIAAASYGPLNNSTLDFFLFRRNSNVPVFEINTPGSLFYVDMASDGSFCTVGGKAVHARIMGSGGNLYSIDCDLGGGFLSGIVDIQDNEDNSGVKVEVQELIDYFDFTDYDGYYSVDNVPAGVYSVEYTKVGYLPHAYYNVVVTEGETTELDEVSLVPFGSPPLNFTASQSTGLTVDLSWDEPAETPSGYNIYRKSIQQDPYPEEPYATVPAEQTYFSDDGALPFIENYYVVTATIGASLQSPYSNEAVGWISTGFVVDEISVYYGTTPVIDGVISTGEWDDAFMVDCSDFWGTHDNTINPIGSVIGYFKMNSEETELYVAYINYNDTVLEDHDEVALYIDDNNDGTYPPSGDDSEGNYWAAYYAAGNQLKYRPIYSTGGVGTVIYLADPQLEVSVDTGYLVYEFVVPIGTETWEINPSDLNESGIGIFVLDDNAPEPHGFDAWWPLDNLNIFSPVGYGKITYGLEPQTPPPPDNLTLYYNEEGYFNLTWNMPGINDFDHFNIYVSIDESDFELYDNTVGTSYNYEPQFYPAFYQLYITTVNQMNMESEPSEIVEEWTVDTDNETVPSLKTKLLSNYPNPFNPASAGRSSTTTIEFTTENTEKNTELIIYNIKGQKVKTLYKGKIETGKHSVVWDGKDENNKPVSSGLYLYKLEAGKYNSIKKMLLIK